MENLQGVALHVIILAALVLSLASAIAGYSSGDLLYLLVLTSSILIAFLAAILYTLEDVSSSLRYSLSVSSIAVSQILYSSLSLAKNMGLMNVT